MAKPKQKQPETNPEKTAETAEIAGKGARFYLNKNYSGIIVYSDSSI